LDGDAVKEVMVGGEKMAIAAEAPLLTPFSVAFTRRVVFPAEGPAVTATIEPAVALRLAIVFVSDQEYVVPGGHVPPVQLMVAVKLAADPVLMVTEEGVIDTEERLPAR
jgi:hypothetical protein